MTFLDANVLLELALRRAKAAEVVLSIKSQEVGLAISPLTIHLIYHFGRRQGLPADALQVFLQGYEVLPMDAAVVDLAQSRHDGRDFEDCLQAACAEIGGCGSILTLDKTFQPHSGIKLPVTVL